MVSNFLIFIGNLSPFPNYATSEGVVDTISNGWLDLRSMFSDVGVFVITGFLTVISILINKWISNNNNWKEDREKFEMQQVNTNQNIANAVKLIVDDLKQYKEVNSKENDEIRGDYQSLNSRVIMNEERLRDIKEDIRKSKN